MPFYVGNVFSSGPSFRAPEFLYHDKQFYSNALMPNYGVNNVFPSMDYGPFGVRHYGSPGSSQPTVPLNELAGDCEKFQFVTAVEGGGLTNTGQVKFWGFDTYGYGDDYNYGITVGGYIQRATSNAYYAYVQAIIEYQDSFVDYVAELNVSWFDEYIENTPRYTLIFGVDPLVNLSGLGGIIYEAPPTQQIPWQCWLNGKPPGTTFPGQGGTYTLYGSYPGKAPPSCSSWLPNVPSNLEIYEESYTLGWALYRGDFLNQEERRYWHEDHDWLTNPGFV